MEICKSWAGAHQGQNFPNRIARQGTECNCAK